MRYLVLILATLAIVGVADSAPPPIPVSMIELIANPEKFANQIVEVEGFAHIAFEEDSLFLHKEDFDNANTKNALRLSVPRNPPQEWQALSGKHVLVVGLFKTRSRDDLFSGSLIQISRFERWPRNATP